MKHKRLLALGRFCVSDSVSQGHYKMYSKSLICFISFSVSTYLYGKVIQKRKRLVKCHTCNARLLLALTMAVMNGMAGNVCSLSPNVSAHFLRVLAPRINTVILHFLRRQAFVVEQLALDPLRKLSRVFYRFNGSETHSVSMFSGGEKNGTDQVSMLLLTRITCFHLSQVYKMVKL